jgi:hypothetical protein
MNNRERTQAALNYEAYDALPVVHFGYWRETLQRWTNEGHISEEERRGWQDGNEFDHAVSGRLGFDFNWYTLFQWEWRLYPRLEKKVIEELPDGGRKVINEDGVIVIEKTGITSISTEIDHTLRDRASWEEIFKPRLQFSPERIRVARANMGKHSVRLAEDYEGGIELLRQHVSPNPVALHCGSLLGMIRDWLGLMGLSYLMADDPELLYEMLDTVAELEFQGVRAALATGAQFDYAMFWEDMAYKGGPLVNPKLFRDRLAPNYKRITELLAQSGITIVSLDCDGVIDKLIPIWLENGVNTMFPIEVGTWNASIAPWRERFGRAVRGVGGVDKRIFGKDRAAIDAEIERQRPLVALGGYIPCPDHRIPGDAKWELVQYYCDRVRAVFG